MDGRGLGRDDEVVCTIVYVVNTAMIDLLYLYVATLTQYVN